MTLWLKDTGERVLVTLAIAVLGVLIAATKIDISVLEAAATAGFAAIFALVKQGLIAPPATGNLWLDLFNRLAWSFVQGFAAVATAGEAFDYFDFTALRGAAVGGLMALFSLLKGLLAARMTARTVTPASLAKTT